jgi:hypothetical protein
VNGRIVYTGAIPKQQNIFRIQLHELKPAAYFFIIQEGIYFTRKKIIVF